MSTAAALITTAFCFGMAAVIVGSAVWLLALQQGWQPLAARREHRERMARINAVPPPVSREDFDAVVAELRSVIAKCQRQDGAPGGEGPS